MKTTYIALERKKHTPSKVRSTLLESVSVIVFIAGLWYLWAGNLIPLYAKTAVLTIIGGIFVFAVGQIIQKGFMEPVQELQKTIGEIGSALLVYANTSDSIIDEDSRKEATRTLRQLSGDLLGKRRVVANYGMCERLEILPPRQNINDAIRGLVQMSNCVGSNRHEAFCDATDCIKKALWLDD